MSDADRGKSEKEEKPNSSIGLVDAGNTAMKAATTGLVHVLGWLHAGPKLFAFVFFLLWNGNTCLPGPAGCVTPVSQWTTGAGAWLDEQKVKGA